MSEQRLAVVGGRNARASVPTAGGAPAWSAAWTAAVTSYAVSASMTMFRLEQHAADDVPGVRGRILRVGGHVSPPS
jgi:hypothetical protein